MRAFGIPGWGTRQSPIGDLEADGVASPNKRGPMPHLTVCYEAVDRLEHALDCAFVAARLLARKLGRLV